LTESNLRDIIRGVIQEMFDEDLQEDANLPGLDDAEKDEAMEMDAEAGAMELDEDSGKKEKENYEKNVAADKKHMKALKKDMEYDKKKEKLEEEVEEIEEQVEEEVTENLQESFLPKGRDIRTEARRQTFEKLVSKWCK
jgi:hypothetical protein